MKKFIYLFIISLFIFTTSSCNKEVSKKISAEQLIKKNREYIKSVEKQKLIADLQERLEKDLINQNVELRGGRDTGCCVCSYIIEDVTVSSPVPSEYYWELQGTDFCPDICPIFRAVFNNSSCLSVGGLCEDVITLPATTYFPFNCCVTPNSWIYATGIGFGFDANCEPDVDNTYTIRFTVECSRKYNTNPNCNVAYTPVTRTVVLTSNNLTSGTAAIKLGGECGCQPLSH